MQKALLLSALFITFLVSNTFGQTGYNIGDKVDDFAAKNENNKSWDAKNFLGKKNVVVYFYPAAMTGGCTEQACAYRDDLSILNDLNAIVVGISGDDPASLKLFKEAHSLNFTLLSDPNGEIAKHFGVPVKEGEKSIIRTISGIEYTLNRSATTARWTFVIDKTGKVVYKSTNVNAAEDSQAVIKALKKAN